MAEDDSLLVHIYEKKFKSAGYDIVFAMDGEEAIEKLKTMEMKPSLVMLDGQMPRKSGFEVVEEMKKDPDLKNIPIVFLTNMFNPEDEKKGKDLGIVEYLIKSQFIPSEIVEKIKEVCAKNNIN